MTVRVYIPEAFIALHNEIKNHPLLVQRIQKHPHNCGPEIVLAEVAAYVLIGVNGTFDEDDLAVLADKCLQRLQAMKPRPEIYIPEEDWSKVYEQLLKEIREKEIKAARKH